MPSPKPTYAQACAAFDWSMAHDALGWPAHGPVALAETIADRHARRDPDRIAIHWLGTDGSERRVTFGELATDSARFGNRLRRMGVAPGDRVATVLPRIPEAMPAMVGALRAGAVVVPMFTGFAPDAIAYRLKHSGAKVACVAARYRHLIPALDGLDVLIVDDATSLAGESDVCEPAKVARDDPAFIIYTSGSTGLPKGGVIATNILAAMWPYIHYGLDLRVNNASSGATSPGSTASNDVFWPTGDPSWGYGLCCYLPALALGAGVLCVENNATTEVCRDILARFRVTNLATTPTVLRGLMAQGDAIGDIGNSVRVISSCGEPLNGEVVSFFRRIWGVTPMDHFGATEFGLPIGNHNAVEMDVRPGSMGLPAPGQDMAVVDEAGERLPPGEIGLIAQRDTQPGRYFMRYWNDEAATAALRRGAWRCTGDLGRCDTDGYFWFEGRADDMIKSSGYRIGPFEIESAILKHDAVAEAAAVGVPDPLRGHAIKAYVVLRPGATRTPQLTTEIVDLVTATCGKYQAPREVAIVDQLPKTQTGKIQRFLLRQS